MPVSSEPDAPTKLRLLEEACRKAGFSAAMPDFGLWHPDRQNLSLPLLSQANAVVVDLSGERPSCYFELGYAAALGRPLIVLARAGTALHQTPPDCMVAFYETPADMAACVTAGLLRLRCGQIPHFASVF